MDHKAVHDDSDCQKLVSTFSQFFTDKVSKIRANLASALKSSESDRRAYRSVRDQT